MRDTVFFTFFAVKPITPLESSAMPLHPLLARALRRHRLIRFFNSLSESTRNDFDHFIRSVKKEDTRLRRVQQTIELLAETMEAELDPPPLLTSAFARNPKARQGWDLMPQSLRRQYLIAIFRSRFPETRAHYLERTLLESSQYAESHGGGTKQT
ncbi:MAG TPA: YdeI/OmpD-associated family protein [Candidatus Angelobacter sp.]|nr:YdeI/OmpD-associated family protein [Candidatus Angelobacter sp.]